MTNRFARRSAILMMFGLAGCNSFNRDRELGRNQPEIICGPKVAATYTVPQWGILTAIPAACCLPQGEPLPEFGLIETIPQPEMNNSQPGNSNLPPISVPTDSVPNATDDPGNYQAPGLSEPPLLPSKTNRSGPTSPSPSDILPTEVRESPPPLPAEIPIGIRPFPELPQAPQLQTPQFQAPQLQTPTDDSRPQVQNWDEADLPSVPRVADEDLFRYVL